MSNPERNVRTIQTIFTAFGTGDVATILANVSDDTAWGFNGGRREVAWHGPWRGKAGLPGFFEAMGRHIAVAAFEPRAFHAVGDHVFVPLRIAYSVKDTGKQVDEEQLQWWTCDDSGKVVGLQHYEDTAQVLAAVTA